MREYLSVKRFRNGGLFQRTPTPNLVAEVQVGASPACDRPWGVPWWPLPASRWPQQTMLSFNTSAYWLAFKTQAVLKQGWTLKPECVKIEGNKSKREHNKEPMIWLQDVACTPRLTLDFPSCRGSMPVSTTPGHSLGVFPLHRGL